MSAELVKLSDEARGLIEMRFVMGVVDKDDMHALIVDTNAQAAEIERLKTEQEKALVLARNEAAQRAYEAVFIIWGDAVRAKQVADAVLFPGKV